MNTHSLMNKCAMILKTGSIFIGIKRHSTTCFFTEQAMESWQKCPTDFYLGCSNFLPKWQYNLLIFQSICRPDFARHISLSIRLCSWRLLVLKYPNFSPIYLTNLFLRLPEVKGVLILTYISWNINAFVHLLTAHWSF